MPTCKLCGLGIDMLSTFNGECKKAEDGLHVVDTKGQPMPTSLDRAVDRFEVEKAVRTLLYFVGRNPNDPADPGVRETPRRVAAALEEMTCGRHENPAEILGTTFEVQNGDQIIISKDIPFDSLCEHHLLPFTGTVDIGYLPGQIVTQPNGADFYTNNYRVVGLSKLARLVDCFSQRTQLQERMTREIADALMEHLKPRGVAVVARASHSCMSCRGVKKSGSTMITSCMLGTFLTDPAARSEFLELCRQGRA